MKTQSDFADWLSPMLVKELRQGMRSRAFVVSFLLLQGAMIFLVILGLAASAAKESTGGITGFFWTIVGVPLVLIMPMSGLNSVANERKANTLELIFLTRLTARRIISGKWFALVAQTLLLVCGVLPYAVLRYFLGGVNISGELLTLVLMLLGSALLSGITVGISPQSTRITRALLSVGIVIGLQAIGSFVATTFAFGGGMLLRGAPMTSWKTYVAYGVLGITLLLMMLEFGASKIAPSAENHSTPKRLLALLALLTAVIFTRFVTWSSPVPLLALPLIVPICIGALCEPTRGVASVYRPFTRFGFFGKLAGRVLYPGWPSGVFFALLILLAVLPGVVAHNHATGIDRQRLLLSQIAIVGALFFPAALIQAFRPDVRRPGVVYILIQAAFAILVALASLLQSFHFADLRPLLAMIPTCALFFSSSSDSLLAVDVPKVLIAVSAITAASLLLLFIKMRAPWREIRVLEKTASTLPAEISDASDSRAAA